MKAISTGNAEHYKWGDDADGWHLLKSNDLSIIEESVPPGGTERRHYHTRSQQFFYVLTGIASIEMAGETVQVHAGEGFHIPAGLPHQLMNNHTTDLRFLVVSQPQSHGDRVDA